MSGFFEEVGRRFFQVGEALRLIPLRYIFLLVRVVKSDSLISVF